MPWLRFYSETVQGWRSKIEAFDVREMALFGKMLELEKRRQRAAEGELADDSYVPDFVYALMGALVDDGKALEDKLIIKQAVVTAISCNNST